MLMINYKKTARTAGVWWIMFILIAPFSYLYVDGKLLIPGDVAATLSSINSDMALFWSGFAAYLAGYACFILLAKALCGLFKTVDPKLTRWMIGLVIAGTALVLIGKVSEIAAAYADMEDAAFLFNLRTYIEMAGELFWGLWLIPLVMLIFKSDLIPKAVGGALLGAVVYHLAVFGIFFVSGVNADSHPALLIIGLGELVMALWLLIKGVKRKRGKLSYESRGLL